MTRILLVEDDADLALIFKLNVDLDGVHDLRIRGSAEDVTEADIDWCGSAVIDWRLPEADGGSVVDRIRARRGQDVWVVVYSAETSALFPPGVDRMVSKGQDFGALRAVIDGAG